MINLPVIQKLRRAWWYASDPKWRNAYLQQRRQQRDLSALQRAAFERIWGQTNGRVAAGPFKGLTYLDSSHGTFPQKLLGTYEKELWAVINEAISKPYKVVVDIGAAEGFYVCGMAALLRGARVVAFEAQAAYHRRIRALTQLNGVEERVVIHGSCTTVALSAVITDERSLVICDVEGGEWELLDPAAVPGLAQADILVEVHEHFCPGVREVLCERFALTHELLSVLSRERTIDDLPGTVVLDGGLAMAAMDERRGPPMEWLWLQSRIDRSGL